MQTPEYYTSKLTGLATTFSTDLGNFPKTYVDSALSPTDEVKKTAFKSNLAALTSDEAALQVVKNNVLVELTTVANNLVKSNEHIMELDQQILAAKTTVASLYGSDNAANGSLVDAQHLYNLQYVGNWVLLALVVTSGLAFWQLNSNNLPLAFRKYLPTA